MTNKWSRMSIAAAGAGLAALIAGMVALTVSLWPADSAEAKADFCNSLTDLAGTVMSYQGLDPLTASNDDRQAAVDDISQAWDNVVDDAYDWANAYDNPLNGAYNDLYDAIDNLPSDYSIAQDLKAVEPQLAAFPQAFHDTFDGTGCQS